ncbi:MAG: hypothetical protein IJ004_00465 [Clostridia bacterium]|nr:hypothetical protein [Clostridia bacterium]
MNRCINPECRAVYTEPLKTFLGEEKCPKCCKNIFPSKDTVLKITPESRALYVQSERLFKEGYLLDKAKGLGFKSKQEAKKLAIEKCLVAGLSLHDPYALLSLAFYYERGYVDEGNDTIRAWKNSLDCNSAICLNTHTDSSFRCATTDDSDKGELFKLDAFEISKLQLKSGVAILRLLEKAPYRFRKEAEGELKGRVASKVLEISKNYPELVTVESNTLVKRALAQDSSKKSATENTYMTARELVRHALDLRNSESKSMMLMAYMTNSEVEKLYDPEILENSRGARQPITELLKEELGIYIYAIPTEGRDVGKQPIRTFSEYLNILSYRNQESQYLFKKEKEYCFSVFAINAKKKISAKGITGKKIKQAFEDNSTELMKELNRKYVHNEYVFTTDDVLWAQKENASSAAEVIEFIIDKIPLIY